MENTKACLPDVIQSRIEDLVNGQTMDEEIIAHMDELGSRIAELVALAREDAAEQARQLGEDIEQLSVRIRRDYVAIAYRQGVADGERFKQIVDKGSEEPHRSRLDACGEDVLD